MEGLLCTIAEHVLNTIVSLLTTAFLGALAWLVTLRARSNTIRSLVSNTTRNFDLYYRGDSAPELNKRIFFNPDGSIGGRSNSNEHHWSVKWGNLEIYASCGQLYSKFRWDKHIGRLVHVNDPRLPSVMGQYIVPLFIPAEVNSDNKH